MNNIFRPLQSRNNILGIPVHENSIVGEYVIIGVHTEPEPGTLFSTDCPNFPLAHVGEYEMSNTTLMGAVLKANPHDDYWVMPFQFRYHHRDSQSPDDGLDLKRRYLLTDLTTRQAKEALRAFAGFLGDSIVGRPIWLTINDVPKKAFELICQLPTSYVGASV